MALQAAPRSTLRFKGSANFRQRIVLATLSARSIRIDDIRAFDEDPGLRGGFSNAACHYGI